MNQHNESREWTILDLEIIDLKKKKALVGNNEANEAHVEILCDLGEALYERFEQSGNPSDVDEAISNQQQAVSLTPDGHEAKPMRLNNLGISFQSRFRRTGELSDLEQAISIQQVAVSLTSDGHAGGS